jgi:hypothetical protein
MRSLTLAKDGDDAATGVSRMPLVQQGLAGQLRMHRQRKMFSPSVSISTRSG